MRKPGSDKPDDRKLDEIVAAARRAKQARDQGYREQSLKIHGWICARCGREFTRGNLHLLTVHHKDGNHDYNPPDGGNWENLCVYCHENEHSRHLEHLARGASAAGEKLLGNTSHQPFAGLKELLKKGSS